MIWKPDPLALITPKTHGVQLNMRKQILYAEANYQAIVRRNGHFVDKTNYIRVREESGFFARRKLHPVIGYRARGNALHGTTA